MLRDRLRLQRREFWDSVYNYYKVFTPKKKCENPSRIAQGFSIGNLTEIFAREENVATFHFSVKKSELLNRWTRFVNKLNWTATSTAVLCKKHVKEDAIKRGKRTTLNWNLNPIPTIQTTITRKRTSLPAMSEMRRPPKIRSIEEDQISDFNLRDVIKNFKSIDPVKHWPKGYEAKVNSFSLFYRTVFDEETGFPSVSAAILIDQNLHVKLQCNGAPVPLPKWFTSGRDAKLTKFSMLDNFSAYIESFTSLHQSSTIILEELRQRENCHHKGRPPYSSSLLRYSLLLRYTSPQCYCQLLQHFPLPSFSLLKKLNSKGVHAMKAAEVFLHQDSILSDVILMADEMYLQKGAQFHAAEFVGANSDGELFGGIMVFMIVGLKKSIPIIVRALP